MLARRSFPEVEPAEEPVSEGPVAEAPAAAEPARNGAVAPPEDRAVAVELGPIVSADEPRHDDSEADPQDVRRSIETASRSFDPDHQIRRAMDAFLSPGVVEHDRADN